LGKRLGKFGLELSAEKTQIIPFSAKALGREASSFDFLGFEFRWGKDRKDKPHVDKRRRCGVVTSVFMATFPVSMRSIFMPSGRCGNFSIGAVNERVTIGLALIN
jgi:hypothetical protein